MNWPIQNLALRKFPAARIRIVILMIATLGLGMIPAVSFARIAQEPGAGADPAKDSDNEPPTLSAVPASTQRMGSKEQLEILEKLQTSLKQQSLSETDSSSDLQEFKFDQQGGNKRVETIHQRIRQLKAILEKERSAAEANRRRASQLKANNSPPVIPSSAPSAELNPPESKAVAAPVIAQTDIKIVQPKAIEQDSELPPTANPLPDGIQVLSNPVNSFELANSLYATGSYGQALKSYESLLQEDVSEYDRNWLLCLSANCYRLQGDRSKAESLYREVISTREKSYAADYSQWFLDHLTNKKQIQEELRLLTGELDTLAPGDSQ